MHQTVMLSLGRVKGALSKLIETYKKLRAHPQGDTPMRKHKKRNNESARRRKKRYDAKPPKISEPVVVVVVEDQDPENPTEYQCSKCGRPAELVDGLRIYQNRPDLSHLKFWICDPCDSRVGCHKETSKPLGKMADKLDRYARIEAHKLFECLFRAPWCGRKEQIFSKNEAYRWLAQRFDAEDIEGFGLGYLDAEQCRMLEDFIVEELVKTDFVADKETYKDYLF